MERPRSPVRTASFALLLLLCGCPGQIDILPDSGPQPISHYQDGLQFPDGVLAPDRQVFAADQGPVTPDQGPSPDQGLFPHPDSGPSADGGCKISCTSSCAIGVSSQCTWDCGLIVYAVGCSGLSGCSQYSQCTCYVNGSKVKDGAYSISTASGGINGALGQAKAEFCSFP